MHKLFPCVSVSLPGAIDGQQPRKGGPAALPFAKLSLSAHFYYFCPANPGCGYPRRKSDYIKLQ